MEVASTSVLLAGSDLGSGKAPYVNLEPIHPIQSTVLTQSDLKYVSAGSLGDVVYLGWPIAPSCMSD